MITFNSKSTKEEIGELDFSSDLTYYIYQYMDEDDKEYSLEELQQAILSVSEMLIENLEYGEAVGYLLMAEEMQSIKG